MVAIIGEAVLPSSDSIRIEGSTDLFVIEGNVASPREVPEVKKNLELIREGSTYRCSFTTNSGEEDIKVREEQMRVTQLSVKENESLPNELRLSFRMLLVPQDVPSGRASESLG